MSKIIDIIQPQGFEVIRDRVFSILKEEIAQQFVLSSNEDNNANVFLERTIPTDFTELPAVNVSIQRDEFDGQSAISVDAILFINIDVYHNSKSTATDAGDSLSKLKLHRMLGICRSILEAKQYYILDFPPGFIQSVKVESMQIAENDREKKIHDSAGNSMGRLVLAVKAVEITEDILTTIASGFDTTMQLELTDKGYTYTVNA